MERSGMAWPFGFRFFGILFSKGACPLLAQPRCFGTGIGWIGIVGTLFINPLPLWSYRYRLKNGTKNIFYQNQKIKGETKNANIRNSIENKGNYRRYVRPPAGRGF